MDEAVVEVSAVGRAFAVPDEVVLHLAVIGRAAAVPDALRLAAGAADALGAVLDEHDVASSDRGTTGLRVEQDWDHRTSRPLGHAATYDFRVVVRDLEAAGRLIEAMAQRVGDALAIRHLSLGVRDESGEEAEARRLAVLACRSQAEQMATAAGHRLGRLLSMHTGTGPSPSPVLVAARFSAQDSASIPVEAGQYEVAVAVTARYALEAGTE